MGWSYAYDAENRLTQAVRATAPAIDARYGYDALDRRYLKDVTMGTSNAKTRYSLRGTARTRAKGSWPSAHRQALVAARWLGENIVAEYDAGSGNLLRRYVHGPGIDEPIAELSYSGGAPTGTNYFHADHAGTIVARSNASGVLGDTYKYSVYGEPTAVEGSLWRFTGRQLDAETGLYYYRARMYNAALGRYLQTDPAGDVDSLNLYQYAMWDPINKKDPSGRQSSCASFFEAKEGLGSE